MLTGRGTQTLSKSRVSSVGPLLMIGGWLLRHKALREFASGGKLRYRRKQRLGAYPGWDCSEFNAIVR